MKSWHKTAAVGVLALGLAIAGAITARRSALPTQEQSFQRISDRIGCQCGCNQPLSACNHHPCGSADPMRAEIRASLAAGKSEQEVISGFVQQFGPSILSAPPAEGFQLTAWIMPFAVLALGLIVVVSVVRGWRASQPAAAGAAPADPRQAAVVERYARQIDEELERDI